MVKQISGSALGEKSFKEVSIYLDARCHEHFYQEARSSAHFHHEYAGTKSQTQWTSAPGRLESKRLSGIMMSGTGTASWYLYHAYAVCIIFHFFSGIFPYPEQCSFGLEEVL